MKEEKIGMMGGTYEVFFKKVVVISLAIMILSFAYSAFIYAGAYADSIQPGSYRSFGVTGEGKVTAVPDVATFSFSVITDGGKDIGALQKENTEKMNKAITFIKENGVATKDIKTSNYNLSPKYQYFDCSRPLTSSVKPCPPPEIVGYTITQSVSVKIRDFAKIGEIMSGVVTAGANNVSQLSFAIDDQTMVEAGARSEAIMKAKAKARLVAQAGGFRLGRLLSIEDSNTSYYRPMVYSAKAMDMGIGGGVPESAPAPSIEAGSQDVTVNVTLRYEIK
ncbi:MAG: hypothetical protein UT05_C0013G0002 [Parcubacteria group bacterium GW2011_GWF2_38_76]|nr:MAG: hypothetical protein UT05_C0013G0002 [Parcubacteria group bacterium GW2011_GWF2_38_76]HBM45406.1 hypothetical protein [Patescibacteria group bacterium]